MIRQLAAVLLCVAGGCADHSAVPMAQAERRTNEWGSVAPFYAALDALAAGHAHGPVTVLQVGDSHTANDGFSGRMRELLQQRFGDAGRGMLPPGWPFRFYDPAQVSVTATGWSTVGGLSAETSGPFGLALVRQHATGAARMTVRADEAGGAASAWVELLEQPGGGHVSVGSGSGEEVVSTDRAGGPGASIRTVSGGAGGVTLEAGGDGPVDVLGWSVGRDRPGIRYANLGTIGATVDILGRIDRAMLQGEMERVRPALLIVAFGTNEGFKANTDVAGYRALYERRIAALWAAAPGAGLVVVLPPDGVHREATTDRARSCDGLTGAGEGWATPANLPAVRAAQIEVARRGGWAQWDWRLAMSGPALPDGRCAILDWATRDPPYAAHDHVHLLRPGYRQTADALFGWLMDGYAAWRAARHG